MSEVEAKNRIPEQWDFLEKSFLILELFKKLKRKKGNTIF